MCIKWQGWGGHGTSALGLGLIKLCFLGVCVYKMARVGGDGTSGLGLELIQLRFWGVYMYKLQGKGIRQLSTQVS